MTPETRKSPCGSVRRCLMPKLRQDGFPTLPAIFGCAHGWVPVGFPSNNPKAAASPSPKAGFCQTNTAGWRFPQTRPPSFTLAPMRCTWSRATPSGGRETSKSHRRNLAESSSPWETPCDRGPTSPSSFSKASQKKIVCF